MHPRYRNWETDSLPCDLAMQTDIQAYNYRYMYFPSDGQRFPWMTFYQSEASISNMGPNFFEMNLDKVIGLAYWGAIDYLGESQGWPAKGWAQGVFDIALEPKPKAYLMKSLFTEEPLVHIAILEDSNADMMWNGVQTANRIKEVYKQIIREAHQKGIYVFGATITPFKGNGYYSADHEKGRSTLKGKLEAVGYINNKVVTRHALETSGKPVRIIAEPDNLHWKADGLDLQHVRLTAVDSKGRRIRTYNDELTFEVEGDAKIVAVTNGDITSDELNTTNHRRLWQGSAMVILRAGKTPSKITLKTKPGTFKDVITRLETIQK